jgi:excisionase family DNA binding protein
LIEIEGVLKFSYRAFKVSSLAFVLSDNQRRIRTFSERKSIMYDNDNEVTVVEQDLLMTVEDFAQQEGVTSRTVYRWIEQGRLDIVERLGKKYVNASIPLKTPISDNDNAGHDTKSSNGGALQNVNIFEEYLKTIRENGRRSEKSCRRWQASCFLSSFLFIIALLACTALSLLYYYGTEGLSDKLKASSAELAEVESARMAALGKLGDLNVEVEKQLQPYKDENLRLQKRLDEAIARNDELGKRLDETFDRNIELMKRLSEKAANNEVVPAGPEN